MHLFLSDSLDIKSHTPMRCINTQHPASSEGYPQHPNMEDEISLEPRDLGRALCIITGASKGFGRTLAFQLSCLLKPRSVLVLVARTAEQLNQLKEDIITLYGGQNKLEVCCVRADLEKKEGVEKTVQAAKETSVSELDHILLINNAGALESLSAFTVQISKYSIKSNYRCHIVLLDVL